MFDALTRCFFSHKKLPIFNNSIFAREFGEKSSFYIIFIFRTIGCLFHRNPRFSSALLLTYMLKTVKTYEGWNLRYNIFDRISTIVVDVLVREVRMRKQVTKNTDNKNIGTSK